MSFHYRVNKTAYIGLGNTTDVSTIYTGTFGQKLKNDYVYVHDFSIGFYDTWV